ncbi:hypothetical protein ABZY20_18865 [Streptomyces sp. NPDC006624]|uniref:hypothetical protein n=1 Tax=Streptomyces sp. NPDC006624 TaxID=3154892 RepID=UPI0033A71FDD
MQHFPTLSALYTPRPMSGASAAAVLSTAFAGEDDALADLLASLGAQADIPQPRSSAAAELHAALLDKGRETAARLS